MKAKGNTAMSTTARCKVVIIGAGFAGLAAVRALRDSNADITLVDRNNHHLFQPFLFQVATAILEPAEIATPIRSLMQGMPNVRVEMREARRIDLPRQIVVMNKGDDLAYDILVVATGVQTSYFGHEAEWAPHALGLKSLGDAITARNRLLKAFERAELETDPEKQARDMTVVVVGGGPTGVAITGTISEFARRTLASDFRNIDLRQARIVLVQSGPRLLPAFSERHSAYAARALEGQGVEVRLGVPITHVDATGVVVGDERIAAATVLWCTGVEGVPLARTFGAHVKPDGTVAVLDDFSVPGHPECFVVGDAAHIIGPDGGPVPGLASVAQDQGRYVGRLIAARLANTAHPKTYGSLAPSKLATISRHVGVAEFRGRSIIGFPAWLLWGLLHLRTLSGGPCKAFHPGKLDAPSNHLSSQWTADRRAVRTGNSSGRARSGIQRKPRRHGNRDLAGHGARRYLEQIECRDHPQYATTAWYLDLTRLWSSVAELPGWKLPPNCQEA